MLEKLTIRNFQGIRKATLRFHRRVTIIVGKNDRGKSARLRALRWVCLSRPLGKGIARRGSKKTSVVLRVDGRTVEKSMDRGTSYKLDGKRFDATGTTVPEAIRKVLRVGETNFQRQSDNSFLLSLPPGQIAKELNSIVDLESIDQIQSQIAKAIREKESELKVIEARLSAAKQNRRALAWVRQIDAALRAAETQAKLCRARSHRLRQIASAVNVAMGADAICKRSGELTPIAHSLSVATRQAQTTRNRLSAIEAAIADARAAERAIIGGPIRQASRAATRANRTTRKICKLSKLLNKIALQQKESCKCQKKLSKAKKKLEKRLGGRCPLCGGILTDQTMI